MTASVANNDVGARPATDSATLVLVIGAGIVSAFQVGKVPVVLQSMRADLGVDLGAVSWVLSAFALVGALASLLVGAVSDRIQARRAVIAGLAVQAAGSAFGALATGLPSLLATRALEGLGFLAVTVAAPAMVVASTTPASRKRAFAAWATFMPVGMAVVMLAAPLLGHLGWRGLWWANAWLLAGYAVLLASGTHRLRGKARGEAGRDGLIHSLRNTLGSGGAWFLAGQFCAYTTAFFALFGFLPTLLGDRLGVGEAAAGMLSAIAVAAGAAGCIACGALLDRGWRASQLLVAGFSTIALCSIGILLVPLPGELAYMLCVLFSFAGAFIPVVVFDAAPRLSSRPSLLGSVVGLATQGNNVGIVIGPAAAGAIAGAAGWSWVAAPVIAVALAAAFGAHAYRHRLEAAR
ncbi:CynX/NimT family MFS transporter [Luteimonas arsenica]|uniref:MFS transporter n=1 Tax=Luteimonas arsenica TaxID=1586242 RepID=UPI0010567A44|nr:MFS transporter [Luteimonas arsenica]